MLKVLVNISLDKFCCKKESWGYAKEKVKKREKEKNGHKTVRDIEKNGYFDARLKKRKQKYPLISCKNIFKFQERDMFLRSKVELG